MVKKVLFGKESRDLLLSGVQKITKAVRVTMGSSGKCVMIGNGFYGNDGLVHLPTIVTKDGVTVCRHFQLEDPIEQRGAMLVREAAEKTVYEAGDATTLTCVLAEALITGGMKLIDEGASSPELKKSVDEAVEYVIAELRKISTPVRGDIERVRQVATVSSNNDKFIGDLIAEAFSKIGFDGVIDIEKSNGVETSIKISEGLKFERGWVSPLFITNPAKDICEFENPIILLYDKKITHHTQIQRSMEIAVNQGSPLLIICEDAEQEGLAFLAMNNYQKRVRVCVVKSPEFGEIRREWMEDIALLVGGSYISDIRGVDIKNITAQHLGKAKKVIISKDETVIIDGEGKKEDLEDLLNNLKMNLAQAKTEEEKNSIEKRIARLTGGIAVIQVGGSTETELNEKLDRVDDAVRATKAAISDGFLAGGGSSFLRTIKRGAGFLIDIDSIAEDKTLDDAIDDIKTQFNKTGTLLFSSKRIGTDLTKGENLVFSALYAPLLQICENAGVDGLPIIKSIQLQAGDNRGYNVLTGKIEDMVTAGIIDSTKALISALKNAASVAGMILTSECSIITVQ